MELDPSKQKIIWAIDPFARNKSLQRATAWILYELAKEKAAEVEPVYIFGNGSLEVFGDSPWDLANQIQQSGNNELQEILKRIQIPGIKPLKVLSRPGRLLREGVDVLVHYAHEQRVDLIVVSTRARKGPRRWVIGSFAETLILTSDIPLFVINPSEKSVPGFRNILFPTDFSPESKHAFGQVVKMAKARENRITLFHKVRYDWMLWLGPSYVVYPEYLKVFNEDIKSKKIQAEIWIEEAARHGVRVVPHFGFQKTGSPADAILKQAAKKNDMIAMAARSGRFEAALLGSTTRKVVRGATAPVWVVHTPVAQETEKIKGSDTYGQADNRSIGL